MTADPSLIRFQATPEKQCPNTLSAAPVKRVRESPHCRHGIHGQHYSIESILYSIDTTYGSETFDCNAILSNPGPHSITCVIQLANPAAKPPLHRRSTRFQTVVHPARQPRDLGGACSVDSRGTFAFSPDVDLSRFVPPRASWLWSVQAFRFMSSSIYHMQDYLNFSHLINLFWGTLGSDFVPSCFP